MKIFKKTLILDSTYRAIAIVDWKTAITLLYLNKAIVIHYYDDYVSSPNLKFQLPSILRINKKQKKSSEYLSLTRSNIFKRDKYTCSYCGRSFSQKELTIDHIQPLARGGDIKSWDNLITSCLECNNKKGCKTPQEANMPLKFKPFKPKWSPKLGLAIGSDYPPEWEDWIW